MRPNVIAMEIADEPPYEINGSVIPFVGTIPRFTAIFIPICKQISEIRPIVEIFANKFCCFLDLLTPRKIMNANKNNLQFKSNKQYCRNLT